MKNFNKLYSEILYSSSKYIINEDSEITEDTLKEKIESFTLSLPDLSNEEYWKDAIDKLDESRISLDNYEPIISGLKVIKIVPIGAKSGSGQFKIDNIDPSKPIKISLLNNPYKKAIFYLIKLNNNEVNLRIINNDKAEDSQVIDMKNKLKSSGGEIFVKTPDGVKGPYDEIQQIGQSLKKADAKMCKNDENNDEDNLYLSLKNGDKAAAFNQYGGKTDLGRTDEGVINENPFIGSCYNLIKDLFDLLAAGQLIEQDNYDFIYLKDYQGLANSINLSEISFPIPMVELNNHDEKFSPYLKTKFGKNFMNDDKSGPENVDVLIDGPVNFDKLADDIKDEAEDKRIISLNGTFHTEWNPSLYEVQPEEDHKEIYDLVVVFRRYNVKAKINGRGYIKFGEFKHCRFMIHPCNNSRLSYIKRTYDTFKKYVSNSQNFKNIYDKFSDEEKERFGFN